MLSRSDVWATLCDPMDCSPPGSSVHGDSPGKNTGVGCYALIQGIFPTQGSNPSLPPCRRILYGLSNQGSPRILEWVAYPFPRGSSQPRNWTRVSCIAGEFFTNWATREAQLLKWSTSKKKKILKKKELQVKMIIGYVSCSVKSDSLWLQDCSPPGSSVLGILQAKIL